MLQAAFNRSAKASRRYSCAHSRCRSSASHRLSDTEIVNMSYMHVHVHAFIEHAQLNLKRSDTNTVGTEMFVGMLQR